MYHVAPAAYPVVAGMGWPLTVVSPVCVLYMAVTSRSAPFSTTHTRISRIGFTGGGGGGGATGGGATGGGGGGATGAAIRLPNIALRPSTRRPVTTVASSAMRTAVLVGVRIGPSQKSSTCTGES